MTFTEADIQRAVEADEKCAALPAVERIKQILWAAIKSHNDRMGIVP